MRNKLSAIPRENFAAWLRLAKPIPASFGGHAVLVLDLGPSGALLSGRCTCDQGEEHELTFAGAAGNVTVRGLVTGVADHHHSEDRDLLVRFHEPGSGLAEFVGDYQEQIRRAELANAEGHIEENVIDGDRMLSDLGAAARAGDAFLSCRLVDGRWDCAVTSARKQPPDGFTISAGETEDQVKLLQLAYEESDDDSRSALREFAAASLPPAT